jgi:hypothetical protein
MTLGPARLCRWCEGFVAFRGASPRLAAGVDASGSSSLRPRDGQPRPLRPARRDNRRPGGRRDPFADRRRPRRGPGGRSASRSSDGPRGRSAGPVAAPTSACMACRRSSARARRAPLVAAAGASRALLAGTMVDVKAGRDVGQFSPCATWGHQVQVRGTGERDGDEPETFGAVPCAEWHTGAVHTTAASHERPSGRTKEAADEVESEAPCSGDGGDRGGRGRRSRPCGRRERRTPASAPAPACRATISRESAFR